MTVLYESDKTDAKPLTGRTKLRVWNEGPDWYVATDWYQDGHFVEARHLAPGDGEKLSWVGHAPGGKCVPLTADQLCGWLRSE